jgi:hypothetical protein
MFFSLSDILVPFIPKKCTELKFGNREEAEGSLKRS